MARSSRAIPTRRPLHDIVLTEATTGAKLQISRAAVEEIRHVGTLMPEGIAATISRRERRDLVRFQMELGKPGNSSPGLLRPPSRWIWRPPKEFAMLSTVYAID